MLRRRGRRRTRGRGRCPAVRTGVAIEEDLRRRDFSMNAMALRLSGEAALVDPCGGTPDIEARVVRVLHERSFLDDPTRIFRALRYAARLGFEIESQTAAWMREALPLVQDAERGARAARAGVDAARLRHRGWRWSRRRRSGRWRRCIPHSDGTSGGATGCCELDELDADVLPFGFAMLVGGRDCRRRRRRSSSGCDCGARRRRRCAGWRRCRRWRRCCGGRRRSRRGWWCCSTGIRRRRWRRSRARRAIEIAAGVARRYLAEWRHVKPLLRGDDLIALGVPEGPQVQKGLSLIRASRLDGWAGDEGDERALALRFAKSIRDSAAANSPIELQIDGSQMGARRGYRDDN